MQPNLKFNWGAFALTPAFGFATKQWFCLLSLITPISFIISIISGFLAPKWIYESGYYSTVEEFNAVMHSWDRAGKFTMASILLAFIPLILFMMLIFFLFAVDTGSDFANISNYSQELIKYTNIF